MAGLNTGAFQTTVQWLRWFNHRHDAVLTLIAGFVREHLTPLIIDLPQSNYIYPQHIGGTDSCSDIVVWQDDAKEVNILELTVCFQKMLTTLENGRYASIQSQLKKQNTKGTKAG